MDAEVTKKLSDLSRTARALEEYDAFEPRYSRELMAATTNEEVERLVAEEQRMGEAVGIAFGEDTKGINNPETCRKCVRPGPSVPGTGYELSFVRRMVAKWKVQNGQ